MGSGMNVENGHSSGLSPVSQIATHILCILSSTVSPPALNSSAGTSSGPVALRLAVRWMARATSERSGGSSCSLDTGCLKFKFLDNTIAGCFSELSNFARKLYNFEKSENVLHFTRLCGDIYRCGGQVYQNLCEMSSGFCVPV